MGFKVNCYDLWFGVVAPDSAVLRDALESKGFSTIDRGADEASMEFRLVPNGRLHDLEIDEKRVSTGQSLSLLAEIISFRIHLKVSELCREFTFLMGDTVLDSDGRGLFIGGPRFSGKTRMASVMRGLGCEPFSEFLSVVDDQGRMVPYPSQGVDSSRAVEPAGVLLTRYEPGAASSLEEIRPSLMTVQLLTLLVGGEESQVEALPRLASLAEKAPLRRHGPRGEARATVEAIRPALTLDRSSR